MQAAPLRSIVTTRLGQIKESVTWLDLLSSLLLHLVVIAGAVVFVFPFFWLVGTSLKPESDVFLFPPDLIPRQLEWDNFPAALQQLPFLLGLRNTMIVVAGVEAGRLFGATLA